MKQVSMLFVETELKDDAVVVKAIRRLGIIQASRLVDMHPSDLNRWTAGKIGLAKDKFDILKAALIQHEKCKRLHSRSDKKVR